MASELNPLLLSSPAAAGSDAVAAPPSVPVMDSVAGPAPMLSTPSQVPLGTLGHGEDLAPSAVTQPQHSK